MSPSASKALCVSIHDVAPATWDDCLRLLDAIRAVADIPLTLLVVPRFHGEEATPPEYVRWLDGLLARGHELALHGYSHWDDCPARGGLGNRFLRTVYTQQEGEFAAIDAAEARRRIELGLAWFQQRNWPVAGFIAPAWLLGDGAWSALTEFRFEYTTSFSRFFLLPSRQSLFTPSLVYTARNATGRLVSPRWADVLGSILKPSPMVRLSLHPRDARYPKLLRHSQRLLEKLLASRVPITKVEFARKWAAEMKAKDVMETVPTETQS
jgi:hypothetical protein